MMQSFTKTHPRPDTQNSPSIKLSTEQLMAMMDEEFHLFIDGCFLSDQAHKIITPEQLSEFTHFLCDLPKFQIQDVGTLRIAARLLCSLNGIEVSHQQPYAPLE